jgi:flagellar hook-basal body complex protein FliE
MSDINTVNLLNQIRAMSEQAEGLKVESTHDGASFTSVFQDALNKVNDNQQVADDLKARFEKGDPNVSLAETMVATQKANLGFEATLRVRNKVVQAYQDIMNMPV